MKAKFYPMNQVSKPKNLTKERAPDQKIDRSDDFIVWEAEGGSNDFPQQLMTNVQGSPAASAAVDEWHNFINGDGFVDPRLNELKVNKNQKLPSVQDKLSQDMASMWGYALWINPNANGNIVSLKQIPFETVRFSQDKETGKVTGFKVNPYFGIPQFYEKKDTKHYYPYTKTPEDAIAQIKEHELLKSSGKVKEDYPGQIFWFAIERPLARLYPTIFYYSAVNWFILDSEIQKSHQRAIDSDFQQSAIINIFGNPDDPAGRQDKDGNYTSTVGEEFDKSMQDISGADNAGGLFALWFNKEEQKANLEPFPTDSGKKSKESMQNQVTDQIAIGTKVPRVLLNIATAGKLGDNQEIINAVRVMQGRAKKFQKRLEETYRELIPRLQSVIDSGEVYEDFSIRKHIPFDILPDVAFDHMTREEIREYLREDFGIELEKEKTAIDPVAEDTETKKAQAALRGSVGGVQGILGIQESVSNGLTDLESAVTILMEIYGFDRAVSLALLGSPEENT